MSLMMVQSPRSRGMGWQPGAPPLSSRTDQRMMPGDYDGTSTGMPFSSRVHADYRQTPQRYMYVGEGQGQLGIVHMPNSANPRRATCCPAVLATGATLLIALAVLICFRLPGQLPTPVPPPTGFAPRAPYPSAPPPQGPLRIT